MTRRLILVSIALVAVFLMGCSSDSSSRGASFPGSTTLRAYLTGDQEAIPVATAATGSATVVINGFQTEIDPRLFDGFAGSE